MPLHNVTPTSFDHVCASVDPETHQVCGLTQTALAHSAIEQRVIEPDNKVVLVATCPAGHRESFKMNLTAIHETHPDFSEEHRHQAQQIRAMQRHLGLPVA